MICPGCGREIGDSDLKECECGFFDKANLVDPTVVMEASDVDPTVVMKTGKIVDRIQKDLDITVAMNPERDRAVDKTQPMDKSAGTTAPLNAGTVALGDICGSVVAKCKIEKYLGKGGMGLVYRGRHISLDIPVAVKFLLPEYTGTPEFVQRFYREAQVAAKINHQNVVRVYDCGSENNNLYIIMEYVDGGDLSDLLLKGLRLNSSQGLDVAVSICSALVEAEKFNVIHRDIKPENIMVTSDGTYKLADLGLAKQIDKAIDTNLALTVENVCMGSPLYMPPEQAVNARSCDIRADIYSLGCTLFALLAGRVPYDGDNWQEVVCNHATSPIPSARAINDEVSYNLDRIILKCMQKKPADRYNSAEDLYNDLISASPAGVNTVDNRTFTRIGTERTKAVVSSLSNTSYRTDTIVRSSAYDSSSNDLTCSSCGKECATRSTLKFTCSHDECKKLICMDCWMRNGIRQCTEHSN